MLESITYYNIFGISVLMYLGMMGALSLLATAFTAIAPRKGWAKIDVRWHMTLAVITISIALLHGVLALLARF